nr:hypothetical protein [Tanacetum cinerariifolium]
MNEFCTKKGIRREFSNARTPQQNGVAKRRNITLIEAARTMLADAKLPVTFWAEAVNTAYYVQNRVLANKPFGYHVMILNTLDHLGKFDVKGDEGYFIGYSMSSKAFRVFNKRTKKVEENLYVNFLENKLIEKGAGLNWLFDIDTLTNSMNYVPVVVAGTSSTNISDTSPGNSGDPRIISKGDFSQQETPSLGNALTLSNKFEDIFGEEADLSNMETSIPVSPTPTVRIHKDHPKIQIIGLVDTHVQTRLKSKEMEEQSFIAIIYHKINPELLQFCLFLCFLSQEEPKKIFNALKDPSWVDAMQEELLQFKIQNVWILVDCPKGVRPIGTKWVLKNKKYERGIVIRNKARLVAQVYTQEEGIDYEEVFAPVARTEAIRLFLAYASFMGFVVYQIDVKSAFLYGTIDKEVYVMQPPRFQDPEFPDRVYKVEKAMYGLYQAPRALYGTLSKKHKGEFLLVQVYVDDIIFGSSNLQLCKEFEEPMHDKFQMSAMGELTFFLDGIFLSQDKYVGDILKKFGYSDVRSMIGSLMYLTVSRPNIMFAVCVYARHQVTPKECHFHAVNRIFRYLKGHPKLGLWYPKDSHFDLVAYFDSDYGGATQDRKSTTGGYENVADLLTKPFDAGRFQYLVGEGSAIPTEPHHTPSPQEQHSPHHDPSSPSHPTTTTEPIHQTPTETPTLRQYSRRTTRIAHLDAGQDMENIDKTYALPHESSPRVTSLDADEGKISGLKARVKFLEDKDIGRAEPSQKDAPIKGGSMEIGEEVGVERSTELESNDTEEMVNVLSSMEAANILTSGVAVVSVSPVVGISTQCVPTVSRLFPTARAIFTTASVVTPYTRRSREISTKDKGKEKVVESEVPNKRKLQEQIDAQVAREMEEEFARDNQRLSGQLARDLEIARLHVEEELKMMIEGLDRSNEVMAKHLQEYEQAAADLSVGEKIELINELEQKEFYMSVLRSNAGWKTKHFRGMTLEEIKEKIIPVWKQLEDFVLMSSKEEGERVKRKGLKLDQGSAKRIKTSEDVSEEDLKGMMQLVPLEEVYVEALQVKHPIIDWEIHSEGQREYWKIIRLGGHTAFDREDLHQLWILVKETLSIKQATKDKEKELRVELKRLFEPDVEDQLWTHNQSFMHDPLEWRLYDTCGVHHVFTKDQEIFMLVEKDYPLRKGLATMMICNKLQVEQYSQMANDLILKIHNIANSPR